MVFHFLVLVIGVFSCSTAVIFIKISSEHPLLLAAYRLLIAALVLTPFFVREMKRQKGSYSVRQLSRSLLPGIALAFHFITWIVGARMTLAANATLIVNMVPAVMPFFLFFLSREIVKVYEVVGTGFALFGITLLGLTDIYVNRTTFLGDVLCLISMFLFTFYLALSRKNRDVQSIWLYIVPLYYTAGLFSFMVGSFFVNPFKHYTTVNILSIVGLGILPTVFGHSILNYSMKHFRGQLVSVVNLGEFIFATLMGYFILGETPSSMFYVAGILVVTGALFVVRQHRE